MTAGRTVGKLGRGWDVAVDVTVRGAGVFGLSVAWACARRGARVRVVDPRGVAAGASGGIVGALAPHAPDAARWDEAKAFQLRSLLMAQDWWAEVAEAGGGAPGYARDGRLQPVADDAAAARAGARGRDAETLWRGRAGWAVEPAPGGWSPDAPRVVRDTLSARLHPRRACEALAAAIRARGGTVVSEAPDAGAVVHATGWRDAGGFGVTGVKGQAALLRLDRGGEPQLYAGGLHVVPHDDGTVAVGSTSERAFDAPDRTDAALDDVVARARAAVPALRDAPVIERWAGVRPRAPSRAAILGPWPDRPGHYLANGGFKIGFGVAPLAGAMMADLLLDGADRIPGALRPVPA